jgi:hypothetical protein
MDGSSTRRPEAFYAWMRLERKPWTIISGSVTAALQEHRRRRTFTKINRPAGQLIGGEPGGHRRQPEPSSRLAKPGGGFYRSDDAGRHGRS